MSYYFDLLWGLGWWVGYVTSVWAGVPWVICFWFAWLGLFLWANFAFIFGVFRADCMLGFLMAGATDLLGVVLGFVYFDFCFLSFCVITLLLTWVLWLCFGWVSWFSLLPG